MIILGISAFYHDSAAAIIRDGEIIAAVQEERFTRKKHDPSFPINAIRYCLEQAGISIDALSAIVFYDKPLLKFERLLETYYETAPKGLASFVASMPVWLHEKLFLKKIIYDSLKEFGRDRVKKIKLLFPEHHLSHAASAFYPSPFQEAAILTIDGVGEWATASIAVGNANKITVLKQLDFPHSLGLLYSAFTYYCGFEVNAGEYKLMGLAPYGDSNGERVKQYIGTIKSKLLDIKADGSFELNQKYFTFATGLRMVKESVWKKLFDMSRRNPQDPIDQRYCDLALAVQTITNEIVFKLAQEAKKLTASDYLCMAGGVALNCVATGKLDDSRLFREIFIQPASGDAGGALGAAYAGYHIYFKQPKKTDTPDAMKGAYLGPRFSDSQICEFLNSVGAVYMKYDENDLVNHVASYLAEGNVVGWYQGRMEFGPRALGARSILADSRDPEMQRKLNLKIKFREAFRPFAPAVLCEHVAEYFDHTQTSPYMTLIKSLAPRRKIAYPANFAPRDLLEKLYFQRSEIPAVTHVDYSSRIQTVHKETNRLFWTLLQAFKNITGCPVLINTSFNVRDEPIVNTPADAYNCFMQTEMDFLAIGNYVLDKKNQPKFENSKKTTKAIDLFKD